MGFAIDRNQEESKMKTDIAWSTLIEACYQECPDLTVEAVVQQGVMERRFLESLGRNIDDPGFTATALSVYTLDDLAF